MPKPKNNRSKNPADWSARHLLKKAEQGDKAAKKYLDSVRPELDAALAKHAAHIQSLKAKYNPVIDAIVPGYSESTGRSRRIKAIEFAGRMSRHFSLTPAEILDLDDEDLEGLVNSLGKEKTPQPSAPAARVEELTQKQLVRETDINKQSLADAAKAAGLKSTGRGESAVYTRRDWLAMANAHAKKLNATAATIQKWNRFLAKHDAGQIGNKPKAGKR